MQYIATHQNADVQAGINYVRSYILHNGNVQEYDYVQNYGSVPSTGPAVIFPGAVRGTYAP